MIDSGLFLAILESFRDHNPVPLRGAVLLNRYGNMIYGGSENGIEGNHVVWSAVSVSVPSSSLAGADPSGCACTMRARIHCQ